MIQAQLQTIFFFLLALLVTESGAFSGHASSKFSISSLVRLGPLKATPAAVSVCTAELCCCQEEGMGGDEILVDLLRRDLPYAVDEAPCLGACGGGAMVAIDFEDGTSALVSGMDETLFELGIGAEEKSTVVHAEEPEEQLVLQGSALPPPVEPVLSNVVLEAAPSTATSATALLDPPSTSTTMGSDKNVASRSKPVENMSQSKKSSSSSSSTSSKPLVDVRDRMRAEAKEEEEQVASNPWLQAASYLAGKASEKIFGNSDQ